MNTKIYLISLLLSLVQSQCFDSPSILSGKQGLRPVDCSKTPDSTTQPIQSFDVSDERDDENKTMMVGKSKDSMIEIQLLCTSKESTCNMVMDTFITASDYLTNIIKFNTPIKIKSKYISFCRSSGDCNRVRLTLGKAQSIRYHQLEGDDGKIRLYPQALVKQLPNPPVSNYNTEGDIIAEFNSDAPFYFQSEGGYISQFHSDFLSVVSHELVHGLGFSTVYNDYFSEMYALALFPNFETITVGGNRFRINNFLESIFDKYVVFTDSKKTLTSITDVFNGYVSDNKDKYFSSEYKATQHFMKSRQYQVARDLLKTAQTNGTMEFVFKTTTKVPYNSLLLETNLKPYSPASSVSHVSLDKYQNTKEFLMRPVMTPGSSLASLVAKVGSGKWDTAPYGPGLIAMLETMGYTINQNPSPNNITGYSGSSGFSGSSNNPGSSNSGYGSSNFAKKSINSSWALLSAIGLIYYLI